jgi:hypothetical protein
MIRFHRNYIEVEADGFMYWSSRLKGLQGKAKAGAFFPFILTTKKIEPELREAIINHELIHFAQQKEMLVVAGWLFRWFETAYWLIWRRKSPKQTYLLTCFEQEAYDNMFDTTYLQTRHRYSHLRYYLRSKPVKRTLTEQVL